MTSDGWERLTSEEAADAKDPLESAGEWTMSVCLGGAVEDAQCGVVAAGADTHLRAHEADS